MRKTSVLTVSQIAGTHPPEIGRLGTRLKPFFKATVSRMAGTHLKNVKGFKTAAWRTIEAFTLLPCPTVSHRVPNGRGTPKTNRVPVSPFIKRGHGPDAVPGLIFHQNRNH